MKKLLIMFGLVAVLLLFMGCTETKTQKNETENNTEITPPEPVEEVIPDTSFKGFMTWEKGIWVEWKSNEGLNTNMAIVDISEGIIKFQTETTIEGQEAISQIWYNETTMTVTKFVSKTQGTVVCFDTISDTQTETLKEDEAYIGLTPEMGYGTYTTTTGKTVDVAKFKTPEGEYWVSEEVPFGIVKVTDGTNDLMYLNDFGISDAENKITSEDLANCQDLSSMVTN